MIRRIGRMLKYASFGIASKIDVFRGYGRIVPATVGLSVHCEKLYDGAIYAKLLRFSNFYRELTGRKLIVCAHSPRNPVTSYVMRLIGFSDEEYRRRLEALGEFCDIGYHGHFYRGKKDGEFAVINGNSPHADIAVEQINKEFDWFHANGFYPRKYIAGWWYLHPEIIRALESKGIELDFSIRRSGTDTFGMSYLPDYKRPPLGEAFILPPSKKVVEVQTVFGPTSHPYRIGKLLADPMSYGRGKRIYFVFAIHDWDLLAYYREIKSNIEFITRDRNDFTISDFPSGEVDLIRNGVVFYPDGTNPKGA
ncbi:MAG: hypothetical protein ABIJ27_07400 [Candidatus Omnitrophota bacterium]